MNREEHSDTEVIRIWPGQRVHTRTMPSQQLQLGTNRVTSGAITAQTKEEAICQPTNTHNPSSAMCYEYSTTSHAEMKIGKQQRSHGHNGNKASALPFKLVGLSLEKMILSQTDIIWESYIVATYKSNLLDGRLSYADTSTADANEFPCFVTIQPFHASSFRSVAAKSLCRLGSNRSIPTMKEIRDRMIAVATDNRRTFKRKLSVTPIENKELSAKKVSYTFSKGHDTPDLPMQVRERKKYSRSKMFYGCSKNPDKSLKFDQTTATGTTDLYSLAKRYPEKQFYSEETSCSLRNVNTPQVGDCTRDGYKICSVKCRLGSMMKDSFHGKKDVCTSIFIPETDSMVDYTVPYRGLMQKGHCKARTNSEERLFLNTSTDSSVNPHDSLALYPQMTSNVIFNNGDDKSIISQRQLFCKWLSHEKGAAAANMLISCPPLQKADLSFIEENCHFCNKLFLSMETSLPAWLSHHRQIKKQYFLPNFRTLEIADSFLRMPINDFAYSQSSILEVESFTQNVLPIPQNLLKSHGVKAKLMEMKVMLGKKTMYKCAESSHLDYKTALKSQGFCFPSRHLDSADNSEGDIPKTFTEACWMHSCSKKVSDETFEKICLDMYMVELQSDNSAKANCLLHSEKLFCQNQVIPKGNVPMESQLRGCRNECCGATTQHCNELSVSDADLKVGKKELHGVTDNKEILTIFQDGMMHDTYFFKNSIQKANEQKRSDIVLKNKSKTEEHNKTLNLNSSNEAIILNKSHLQFDTANGFLSENVLINEDHGNTDKLQVERAYSLPNSQRPNCDLSGADFSLEGNTAINITDLSSEEPGELTLHLFGMKAQFDLVLEELKMFHLIGQRNEKPSIADDKEGRELMCSTSEELPAILTEDLPCDLGMDGNDCGMNNKNLIPGREQEVPQTSCPANSGAEESLYSPVKGGNTAKAFSWTPSFVTYEEKTINQHFQKEVTFSHGIGRVTPLKTRPGPLRIGLSKRAKIKQLHPYLR